MKQQVRQGDVLLIPDNRVIGKRQKFTGKHILAEGEVTGHHHRFETDSVLMFRHDDGGASIRVEKKAELIHEEHGRVTVVPGIYRQSFQVEYTPKEIRRVAD